jgi:hypothetical protein
VGECTFYFYKYIGLIWCKVNRLAWYGHVIRRDESHITKRVISMTVDGHPRRDRPKKRRMDCVKDEMRIKRVNIEMTSDRREWKKKTLCRPHLMG